MPYDETTCDYMQDDSMGDLVVKLQDDVVKNVYLFKVARSQIFAKSIFVGECGLSA